VAVDGARLLLAVAAGDRDAFAQLVAQYQRKVYGAVFRYVGNRAIAEELTQDVFVRVLRAAPTYERRARFETWLYRIVFNLCANHAEYGKRRRTLSLDAARAGDDPNAPRETADPNGVEPFEQALSSEIQDTVRAAILELPAQQRAALLLVRYQDLSCQEAALALGLSVEAVKSLLFRGREKLRARLAPYIGDDAVEGNSP
jgi:RNA polymerase sigma-70 factor (ECF subfamily)